MHRALRTRLCDRLGIEHPILQAPMAGGWTTPELVAAVSSAGGLGCLAAARTTVDQLDAAITAVRAKTDRPFGVNFLLAPPEPLEGDVAAAQRILDPVRAELGLPPGTVSLALPAAVLREQFELALARGVRVISLAMGEAAELAALAHDAGATVLASATTVDESVRAVASGADIVVAQGADAGGHRATIGRALGDDVPLVGTMSLVPQIVDAVDVPVVAAGGIMDGRGIAAALALGASGVQMGTRFLLATESGAFPAYRRALREAIETDSVVTSLLTGRPARALRNRTLDALVAGGRDPLPWPWPGVVANDLFRAAVEHDDADRAIMLVGQGLRMARDELPAAEIVRRLVREAGDVLDGLAG